MESLQHYAAMADIFSAAAIVMGAAFAIFQIMEYRKRQKNQVAAELCRKFSEPEVGKAVTLIGKLPDSVSLATLQSLDNEYEQAAQVIGMTFETMGLLVHRELASFCMTQELAGGLLLMMWKKLDRWLAETRTEQNNPRFGEWMQYLAERIEDSERDMVPAYLAHKGTKKPLQ
ncbi:MAG: hypothetical protein V7709_07340 [Halioglobus sp.]